MDFIDQLKQFSQNVEKNKDKIQTEEATKTSILLPFFQLMGFDVFNPNEVVPEFTADVGIKKGEKVDYAILQDGNPIILVEAKSITEPLEKHDSQLFRYFGTTTAKIAILTNGLIYKFYTDLDEANKMDKKPFMEINILDIKDAQVAELKKFHKSNFDLDLVINTASELKYSTEIKAKFSSNLIEPKEDFVRFFVGDIYSGRITQQVIEKFQPIVKKSLNQLISEMLNDKLKSALSANEADIAEAEVEQEEEPVKKTPKIVTTQEELEGYFIVKNILKSVANVDDITYKDTESYMSVLYKTNTRKWICRFVFNDRKKILIIPDENKKEIIFTLNNVYEIEKYAKQLKEVLSRYM